MGEEKRRRVVTLEGANMRLTRSELQAALPPKRSTASRTDSNGADVSISALPPPAASEGAAGAAHSASELMGKRTVGSVSWWCRVESGEELATGGEMWEHGKAAGF